VSDEKLWDESLTSRRFHKYTFMTKCSLKASVQMATLNFYTIFAK